MKKTVLFALIILVLGIVITAGCVQSRLPPAAVIPNQSTQTPAAGLLSGTLNISTGNFDSNVSVFIDNKSAGEILPGKPFSTTLKEGRHTVSVCLSTSCEQTDVEIKYAITTAIDFGERLTKNLPHGPLMVSIGNYIGKVNLSVDGSQVGEMTPGKPFNLTLKEGLHTVTVTSNGINEQQDVVIKSGKETIVNFGERLATSISQGRLSVSIGGYNAENLPVFLDNVSVGEVSQGKPIDLIVSEGTHSVKVCIYSVCENETVDIRFAKHVYVDFSEQLKKDVEFTKPTVRIVYFSLNGNYLAYNVEWINPTPHDVTMTATIGVGYSYIESTSRLRRNDFARVQLNKYQNANTRTTQPNTLYLSGGSNIMASEPTIIDFGYQ
jgi:hypothetical protein